VIVYIFLFYQKQVYLLSNVKYSRSSGFESYIGKSSFDNGTLYLILFVEDTLHRHFFSSFHQGYLKFAKKDHGLLILWFIRAVKKYVGISLAHLIGSKKV
jgi:hypothetical protein